MVDDAVDVAVVGGGIVGTSVAAFLAEAGLRVRLFERTQIAAGASGRNSGIVQHPFDPVLADLYRRSLAEYRALAEEAGDAFAFPTDPSGLLYVGRDPGLAERAAAEWADLWPAARPAVVAGRDLEALEPALAPDLVACRLEIGFPVEPAAATRAFAALASSRGVAITIDPDIAIEVIDRRVSGIRTPSGLVPAGSIVVATGPWTPAIVDPSGGWQPIRRSWGLVASIALADAPRHSLESIDIDIEPGGDEADGSSSSPDADAGVDFSLVPAVGSSALGSTFLPTEPDADRWIPVLRRVGARYVPGVAEAPLLGLRQCARPVSRDGRPLLGPAPWCDGLWIAAGHGPWGISTGPGSARLLVDRMLGSGDEIPPDLAAARFGSPGGTGGAC
jgi:glycine/D-amino acid oxidase-like deaminating enzyme